jgi:hypothetical protein
VSFVPFVVKLFLGRSVPEENAIALMQLVHEMVSRHGAKNCFETTDALR